MAYMISHFVMVLLLAFSSLHISCVFPSPARRCLISDQFCESLLLTYRLYEITVPSLFQFPQPVSLAHPARAWQHAGAILIAFDCLMN